MPSRNGHLTYSSDGIGKSFDIYIEKLSQPLQLTGTTAQLRLQRQFYPRAFSPGNASITARATSQDDMQSFSKFIRDHHLQLVNTPGSVAFTTADQSSAGFQRLLQLQVDGEDILWNGWVPNFTMQKKGVMEPAPQFNFTFYVVFDQHSTNIMDSRVARSTAAWWNASNTPAPKPTPPKPDDTNPSGLSIIQIANPDLANAIGLNPSLGN